MGKVGELYLSELLDLIKEYEEKLGAFCGFVLPGETLLGAKAHVLRTVTRRSERAYAKVYEKYGGSEIIFQYLNRLSTFFFALARTFDEK
jgi:cob(I)alamin adenosyltransferase